MVGLDDLSEPQRLLLNAVTEGKLAWCDLESIVADGHAVETVDELVTLELLVRWQAPEIIRRTKDDEAAREWKDQLESWGLDGATSLTLTSYAACLLEVKILERCSVHGEELSEDPYWATAIKLPRSINLPARLHEVRWPWMNEIPDPESVKRTGDVMRDEDGEEVKVMGMTVPIDPKLAKPGQRKAG